MTKALFLMIALSGCADYYASQWQTTSPLSPTEEKQLVFEACSHQVAQVWASQFHPLYAFGAVGAILESSEDTRANSMRQCMGARGYTKTST